MAQVLVTLSKRWKLLVVLVITIFIFDASTRISRDNYFKFDPNRLNPNAKNVANAVTPSTFQNLTNNGTSKMAQTEGGWNMGKAFQEKKEQLLSKIKKIKEATRKKSFSEMQTTAVPSVELASTAPSLFISMPGLMSMDKDLSLPPPVPIRPDSKEPILEYSQKRDYEAIISHDEKCGKSSHTYTDTSLKNFNFETDVFLLMVVKSSCKLQSRRDAIRETWGDERWIKEKLKVIVKKVFLLGDCTNDDLRNKLIEEDKKHGDILQWQFFDSFRNLTLKDCLFMQWYARNCQNVPYIFKGDDDVFVNVENIVNFLKDLPQNKRENLFLGSVLNGSPRILDPSWKYYVSYNLYPEKYYPPYVSGGGFITSGSMEIRLFQASLSTRIIPIDDAFLGILLKAINVKPENDRTFKSWGLKNLDTCRLAKIKTFHKTDPVRLKTLWHNYIRLDVNTCSDDSDDVFKTQMKR